MKDQVSSLAIDSPNVALIENVITLDSGQMLQLITLNHILSKEELEQLSQAKWDSQP